MSQPARKRSPQIDSLLKSVTEKLSHHLKSGDWTERGLASKLGISQPHLHNVLNGTRNMTATLADQILDLTGWRLVDLLEPSELSLGLKRRQSLNRQFRKIRFSDFGLGTGIPFPGRLDDVISVPVASLAGCIDPIAVEMPGDSAMKPVFEPHDRLLVDRSPELRRNIDAAAYYIVQCFGDSKVRRLRESGRGFYLITESCYNSPLDWQPWECPRSRYADFVQAKVIALNRPPDDTFQALLPPSASN